MGMYVHYDVICLCYADIVNPSSHLKAYNSVTIWDKKLWTFWVFVAF